MLRCPECNSTKLRPYGKRYRRRPKLHTVKQYRCANCQRITTKPRGG